jgi:peptidoglycan/LPS O-acetylase OafA/YrhL
MLPYISHLALTSFHPFRSRDSSRSDPPGRSRAIDLLRGVAILLVLGCHFVIPPASAGFLASVAQLWHQIGWAGVDLFFVLSGFLVSGLLFAEFQRKGRVDTGRFLVRRGFKIWSPYFAYLAFLTALLGWQHWRGQVGVDWTSIWPNLLHVQNYFGSPRVHTWSLAVEEHFYLIAAGVAAVGLTNRRVRFVRRYFPAAALASLVLVAAVRQVRFASGGSGSVNLFATHLRFDGLLIGSLLAYLTHFEPACLHWCHRRPWPTLAFGSVLVLPTLLLTPDFSASTAGVGLTVMHAGFALIMLGALGLEQGVAYQRRLFVSAPGRVLANIGFFSYGIYLWHVDFAQTPMKKIGLWAAGSSVPGWSVWLIVTATYVCMAVCIGAVMSRLIEMPALAVRDRFFPSNVTTAVPAVPVAALPDGLAPSPQLGAAIASVRNALIRS